MNSSEDECNSPATKRKRIRAISSDSSDEENKPVQTKKKTKLTKKFSETDLEEPRILRTRNNTTEKKKIVKIIRPDDSSSEEEENTPSKAKNKGNLERLLKKKQEKRLKEIEDRYITTDDDASSDEDEKSKSRIKNNLQKLNQKKKEGTKNKRILSSDDEDGGGNFSHRHFKDAESDEDIDDFIDDDDLPMFKHEEYPPNSDEKASDTEEDDKSAIVEDSNDSTSNEMPSNPYLARDQDMDKTDIIDILSKSTAKDEKNKKKFKKEFGKYQFSIHSKHNKALYTSNKKRYETHMKYTKCDLGFKSERNLDRDDEDFYDSVVANVIGTRVQIYPHTKRVSKFSSKCAISGCEDKFTAGLTKVIGIKMEDDFGQFQKKATISSELFYYMCAAHCPDEEDISTDSYSDDD